MLIARWPPLRCGRAHDARRAASEHMALDTPSGSAAARARPGPRYPWTKGSQLLLRDRRGGELGAERRGRVAGRLYMRQHDVRHAIGGVPIPQRSEEHTSEL